MGLINARKPAKELFKPYTEEERAALAKRYTPAQIAAIEAGEAAIDPEDLKSRGVMRSDPGTLPYFDDLSRTRNVLDRPQKYQGPVDPNPRLMYMNEVEREVQRASKELEKRAPPPPALEPGQEHDDVERQKKMFPTRLDLMKIFDDSSLMVGSDGKAIPVHKNPSLLAPALPKKFLGDEDDAVKIEGSKEEEADPRDPDGLYNRLMKQTGLTLDEIFEFKIKILVNHSVTNQTRLGKIRSMYILAIAGNGDGRLGIGEAKGQEVEETMSNARIAAIRAMQPIPRYEDRTIYGDVEGKVSAVKVQLMARPPGKILSFVQLSNST
jgi:small subunit ribosomal protein S5